MTYLKSGNISISTAIITDVSVMGPTPVHNINKKQTNMTEKCMFLCKIGSFLSGGVTFDLINLNYSTFLQLCKRNGFISSSIDSPVNGTYPKLSQPILGFHSLLLTHPKSLPHISCYPYKISALFIN